MKAFATVAGAALLSLCIASPTTAQMGYFGQNKVQYHRFHFKVLKTQHFDMYYYDEEADGARMAGRWPAWSRPGRGGCCCCCWSRWCSGSATAAWPGWGRCASTARRVGTSDVEAGLTGPGGGPAFCLA